MATRLQIRTVRLAVDDPSGFIAIIEVVTNLDLPAVPEQQTCYYLQDVAWYVSTDIDSGASPSDYAQVKLYMHDSVIAAMIDKYGIEKAKCLCYDHIAKKLGGELRIKSNGSGVEKVEYESITALYNYYVKLHKECMAQFKEDNHTGTGRAESSAAVIIAGGEV